jgi:hypothetical protein
MADVPSFDARPEFWVAPDCDDEPVIWQWDGQHLKPFLFLGSILAIAQDRQATARLWDVLVANIPAAPLCRVDDCKTVTFGSENPDFCPTHTPDEETQ